MSKSSQEKVNMMKSSKTGHLSDSTKEKMKDASILIEDKNEAVNKRYDDDYTFIRYGKTYTEIKRMEHETLDRWMRGVTFGKAHFYCTTLILLFTFFNTCVFLRPLDLDHEVYMKKDHGVYVKLYDENYMKFDQGSQHWHSEIHHSVYMKFDHISVFIQRVKVILVFMAVMVLKLTMVIILDMLGACSNNLGERPLKYINKTKLG